MKITVTYDETVVQLECYEDMELENFVAYCEAEMGQSFANLQLIHDATPLLNMSKTLKEMNIRDGDMILVVSKALLASHAQQQLQQQQQALNSPQAQQQAGSNILPNQPGPSQAFPLDIEAQRLIHEEIQREQIENNMAAAIEYLPESFGSINMLYIKCKVNGVPLEAFVDSGAQSTIMSKACAERCNMMRLIDKRFSGVAKGVGESIIIGKIHMCQIQIENDFLPSSFNVLEDQPMEVLLGLDMLKRHQCIIDLRKGSLTIGTTGTETKFLNDAELPEHARRIARGEQ